MGKTEIRRQRKRPCTLLNGLRDALAYCSMSIGAQHPVSNSTQTGKSPAAPERGEKLRGCSATGTAAFLKWVTLSGKTNRQGREGGVCEGSVVCKVCSVGVGGGVGFFFFCLNLTLEATLKPPCCCVTGMDSLRAANAWEWKSGSISRTGQK